MNTNRRESGIKTNTSGYVARDTEREARMKCSSGGFVNATVHYLHKHGFYICGASFDEAFKVVHRIIGPDEDGVDTFAGSKYVQSNMNDILIRIKDLLEKGNKVCFIGVGCQIDGLVNYLGRKYEGLLTIGLVCHGVPSMDIWKKYMDLQESRYHAKICAVNFRDKTLGYQTPSIYLRFSNGKEYRRTGRVDIMLKSFFSHSSLRYSCFHCPGKGTERSSDLTVFDCWNAEELIGKDDNEGYTAVMAHSETGRQLMTDLGKKCEIREIELERLIPAGGGGMVLNSAKYSITRKDYYHKINTMGLQKAYSETHHVGAFDHVVEILKWKAAGLGIMKIISRHRRLKNRRKQKERRGEFDGKHRVI